MKPAELKPLVGRNVECFWEGLRCGKVVGIPATDVLMVKFLAPIGKRRVELAKVRGVFYYGKTRTVPEYFAALAKKEETA